MEFPNELNRLSYVPARTNDNTGEGRQTLQGSVDGTYFIVGSPSNRASKGTSTGAFGVFKRAFSSNYYNFLSLYQPSDIAAADWFAYSIAINSNADYIVVGAPQQDRNTILSAGNVYIYKKNPVSDIWLNLYQFRNSDSATSDRFGYSVCMTADSTYLAASMPYKNVTTPSVVSAAGVINIYKKSPTTDFWNFIQRVNEVNPIRVSGCGQQISFSSDGTYLVAGLGGYSPAGSNTYGTVIFKKDPTTDYWSQVYKLNQFIVDEVGSNFAMTSNANYILQNTSYLNTSTFLYIKDPTTDVWNFTQMFTVPNNYKGGVAINENGTNISVGYRRFASFSGSVYLYKKRTTTDYWDFQKLLTPSRPQGSTTAQSAAQFGFQVQYVGDGSLLMVAAPNQSTIGPNVVQAGIIWPYSFTNVKEISTNANYIMSSPPISGRTIFMLPKASSTNNSVLFYKTTPSYSNIQYLTFSTMYGDSIDSISFISSIAYTTSYQFLNDKLSNWYTLASYGT